MSSFETTSFKPIKKIKILRKELVTGQLLMQHLEAITTFSNKSLDLKTLSSQISRWGKLRLDAKRLIHSCLSDSHSVHKADYRYSRWFEVNKLFIDDINKNC